MEPNKKAMPRRVKGYEEKEISIFSKNIRKRRMELGKTQNEIGLAVGLNHSRIAKIEQGTFPNNPNLIIALADALEISLDDLFGRNWPKD